MNTSNRSIIRNTFYIQLTAFILLSLSSSVGSMIDGVVIGQFLGVDSIAAFGIINPLMIAFSIIGKSRLASISGFICESGFLILSAAAMMPSFGADAVWLAYPISQLLVMCYYGIVVAGESRRIKIHREGLWNRVLLLPDTFDVLEQDKLDVTVTRMDDVINLTDMVWRFCDEHGCDSTRRNHLALSVEELAGNMIRHGFTDGKPHCIEVRVLKKGDKYYVRFRNDCLIFDPLKQIRLLSDEDPTYHIGLRMIANLAREIQYTCVLKLNNILVKI